MHADEWTPTSQCESQIQRKGNRVAIVVHQCPDAQNPYYEHDECPGIVLSRRKALRFAYDLLRLTVTPVKRRP